MKSLFQFIFSFAPYASRARTNGPQVDAFLMQTEVWAIIVLLSFQARILKRRFGSDSRTQNLQKKKVDRPV